MRQGGYYPHIDGLRALAVLSVIAYHLDAAWLPGGFTGVDVFFVISGYVVSASLANRAVTSLTTFALHFYARRFVRIMPALLLCLLATSLTVTLFVPKAWLSEANEWTALAAFFGISNIVLALKQDAYYSPRAEFNPFIHTWSLGVEEQFYVLFPLVFYVWMRTKENKRHLAAIGLFGLTAASMGFSWWLAVDNPNAAFYLIFSRFWELSAGALLFQLTSGKAQPLGYLPVTAKRALQWTGLVLIGAGLAYADLARFPLPWALLPVLGTVTLILGLADERSGVLFSILSNRVVVGVGRLSYSLYLWHWAVFSLLRWTTGLDSPTNRFMGLGLTLLCAGLSFLLVEQPLRQAKVIQRLKDRTVVSGSLALVALGAGLAFGLFKLQPALSLSVTRDVALWYPHAYSDASKEAPCLLTQENEFKGGVFRQRYVPQACAPSDLRIFVLGDSHAGAYLPMLTRLVQQHGHEVWLYTRGGCSYLNLHKPMKEAGADCLTFALSGRDDVLSAIRPGDVVFLPSLRVIRYGDQWGQFPVDAVRDAMDGNQARDSRKRAVEEGKAEVAQFTARGARVVLEAPKPLFKAPAFRCMDWFNRGNPICAPGLSVSRAELLSFRAPALRGLSEIEAAVPNTTTWDPFDLLCHRGESCFAFDGDVPLFFDGDHLTTAGNMRLYESFSRCMMKQSACGEGATAP